MLSVTLVYDDVSICSSYHRTGYNSDTKMRAIRKKAVVVHVKTVIHFVAGSRKGSVMTAGTPTRIQSGKLHSYINCGTDLRS
jgi:hypothetical protein